MTSFRFLERGRIDSGGSLECLLHPDAPLRLTGARGRRIRCTTGCAWITEPGQARDVFLHCGEEWRVSTNAAVLVEAIGHATVDIRG